jgi:hypothetical protein
MHIQRRTFYLGAPVELVETYQHGLILDSGTVNGVNKA